LRKKHLSIEKDIHNAVSGKCTASCLQYVFLILQLKIDAGESVSDAGVLDFAGLLKQFLRELPEPLLTSRLQDAFLNCYDLTPPSKRVDATLLLCHLLPSHNLSALQYICAFLRRVVDRSVHNKMDAANVGICLAPNIFHASSASAVVGSDATKSMLTSQAGVVELLIDHADEIGVVSDDLHERVAMMTECFSESVLDDCELETTDCRDKKRSGSLQGETLPLCDMISVLDSGPRGHGLDSWSCHFHVTTLASCSHTHGASVTK